MQQVDHFFFGKSLILWEKGACEGGNIDAIISKARNAKLSWIAFKAVDGTNWFDPDFNADLVAKVHTAGMKCYAWGYLYNGSDEEIRLSKVAMNLCDGFIIDAEAEFKGHPDLADKVATQLRGEIVYQQTHNNKRPLLALTSYGDPVTQSDFPYKEFLRNCDVFMPQTYYNAWGGASNGNAIGLINQYGYAQWITLAKTLGDDMRPIIPMLPVYQEYGYNVTGAINTDVMSYLKGYGGLTFWSWQHASQELWDSIANFNDLPFVGSDYPQPVATPAPIPVSVPQPVQTTTPTPQVQTEPVSTPDPLQGQLDALEAKLQEEQNAVISRDKQILQLQKLNDALTKTSGELVAANGKLVGENASLKDQLAGPKTYDANTPIWNMEVKDAVALVWGFIKFIFVKQ